MKRYFDTKNVETGKHVRYISVDVRDITVIWTLFALSNGRVSDSFQLLPVLLDILMQSATLQTRWCCKAGLGIVCF